MPLYAFMVWCLSAVPTLSLPRIITEDLDTITCKEKYVRSKSLTKVY
jgi:hypothetical protein